MAPARSAALPTLCLLLGVSGMPFELTTAGGILFARLFGGFTARELNRVATAAEIAEATHPVSLDRITDLTAVERFDVGFREIYAFAIRRRTQRFSRVVKSAIIVQEPVQLAIALTYEALNENPQIQLRILQSVAEAKEWFADPREAPNE
jgi:hypothetical protein